MEYIFKMSNIIFKSVQPILKVSTAGKNIGIQHKLTIGYRHLCALWSKYQSI